MNVDELVKEVVKQYKQDKKVFKDNNFFLDNTVDIVFDRHDISCDFELWENVFQCALSELGNKAEIYVEEKPNSRKGKF